MKINFFDESHKERYKQICERIGEVDCYRQATAYLLTLDDIVYKHINEVYDFHENFPIHEALNQSWQRRMSKKNNSQGRKLLVDKLIEQTVLLREENELLRLQIMELRKDIYD